ncbi:MAG: T9SS type A sorting domain-containing protein [Saprospiraceae bacterium]|nr:T9SS type A sorting domain-containing protein [Saprospiraceae bacterium]
MKCSLLFALSAILSISVFKLNAQQWEVLAPIPESFTFPVVAVANGKIHIMGGGGVGGATNHHFAYDPATNTWEPKANVPYLAQQPAGAQVNGKIHFFGGGFPNSGSPSNQHHVYDPMTDNWSPAANLTAPRAIHYAVNLDETLFSLAGQGMTTLCQTYDATSNSWITKNPLPDGQFFYGAHVAANHHIYRFCGGGYTAPNNRVNKYDPVSDSWTSLPNFPVRVHGFQGAAIGDQIFLAGGYYDFQERSEVYLFDTKSETLGQYPVSLPIGTNYHNMVSLDSCIYVVGGNHAIDPNVKFQLLRLCPHQNPSGQKESSRKIAFQASIRNSVLKLELPEFLVDQKLQLSIFSSNGKSLYNEICKGQKIKNIEFNNSHFPNGLYIIQIQSNAHTLTKTFLNLNP